MHPVLFKIGPLVIYSYGTMLATAFIVSVLLIFTHARKLRLEEETIISLNFYIIIPAIIGARIFYVILNLKEFLAAPLEILMVHHGGLVFYGGLLGGLLGGIFYVRRNRLPVAQIFDMVAPYIVLGQAIARIGCLLNGCCYGKPISPGVLYPTQLYSSLANLGIFFILVAWSNFKKKNGEVFAGYLLLYSVKRFLIEFLRGDSSKIFFNLTLFQIISLAMGVAVSIWLFKKRKIVA